MPYDEAHRQAWTGALVLIGLIYAYCHRFQIYLQPRRHQGGQLMEAAGIHVKDLNAWFGATQALHSISMEIPAKHATAIIGPSGCGKSTFVRCLNRMHETLPQNAVEGTVAIGDLDVYGKGVSPVWIRRRVGMVFQNRILFLPCPSMTMWPLV